MNKENLGKSFKVLWEVTNDAIFISAAKEPQVDEERSENRVYMRENQVFFLFTYIVLQPYFLYFEIFLWKL